MVADAAYDSKANRKTVEAMGAKPVIAQNPRRGVRRGLKHRELFRKRYLAEQFNGLVKNHVLKTCWTKPKDMVKKTSMVTVGLISLNTTVIQVLLKGEKSLKAVSQYWA